MCPPPWGRGEVLSPPHRPPPPSSPPGAAQHHSSLPTPCIPFVRLIAPKVGAFTLASDNPQKREFWALRGRGETGRMVSSCRTGKPGRRDDNPTDLHSQVFRLREIWTISIGTKGCEERRSACLYLDFLVGPSRASRKSQRRGFSFVPKASPPTPGTRSQPP